MLQILLGILALAVLTLYCLFLTKAPLNGKIVSFFRVLASTDRLTLFTLMTQSCINSSRDYIVAHK
jgi:hypothetical protein